VKLHILAVGDRAPRWVSDACADYQRRFPPHCPLHIKTVPTPRRGRNPDIAKLREQEFQSLCSLIPKGAVVVALDETGGTCATREVSRRLKTWMQTEKDVAFMIGGPDGLAPGALDAAAETWSLSALTLPHALVRVILAEQLYRALSILEDHPYHRSH
jgi:23S rRNA (pseudouridine1915-N3)-methyltransferase